MSGEPSEGGTAPPPKCDPESLVLRAAPRRAIRFRRGLIVGLAGAVCVSFAALTWLALDPPSFRLAAEGEGPAQLRKSEPDALAGAPASYADAPRLGPPLPGDLGRPILEHRRALEAEQAAVGEADGSGEAERARLAREAERQRLAAAEEAARASALMVRIEGRGARASAPAAEGGAPGSTAQDASAAPVRAAAEGRRQAVQPSAGQGGPSGHSVRPAASPWTLSAGTIIPASLITGLNSDLPGIVLAQVTENVRDSATGRTVLIPQGARLVGSYDSVVAFGQSRAFLSWQRIVFPDGSSLTLDSVPAADRAGYSGLEDQVDFHTWRLIKGIGLSTLLGVGTELSLGSGEGDLVRALRESAQQNAARAGDQITARNLEVQPTLTVRPGWPVRAIVHRDLVLRPWRG